MTVLLAGCGDLGTEAGLRFAALGHRVVGWRRSPTKLPAAIEGAAADLGSTDLPPVPADTTAVVIAVAADSPTEEAYRSAYVRGVDENTPPEPGGFSGRVLLEAEGLLQARLSGSRTAGVSLRLGGIYGPGRTRLIDQVKAGSAVVPEDVRYTNRIHRDDAAAAIVHLATMDAAPAPAYVGVDNEPADLGSVLRFLAAQLGLPAPRVGDAGPARGGNKRCRNELLRSTGFTFAFPTFREGYRDVMAGNGVRHP